MKSKIMVVCDLFGRLYAACRWNKRQVTHNISAICLSQYLHFPVVVVVGYQGCVAAHGCGARAVEGVEGHMLLVFT